MEKSVRLLGKTITYKIRKNLRARNIKISIKSDGQVLLTIPRFVPERMGEAFLTSKANWVIKKLEEIKYSKLNVNLLKYPPYKTNRKEALKILSKKVEEVNEFYGFKYGRITIKNQRTCWGSCSRRGNLNFNYKLAFMDPKFADYVITHEICHLKELNHSKRFWDLVSKRLPGYKQIHKEMRQRGLELR